MHASKLSPDAQRQRADYYERIGTGHMTPLWEVLGALVPPQPRSPAQPALWHYAELREQVMEAGRLISAEEAERRVLILENPALRGQSCITQSLYAGLQLILPGEVAPAHAADPFDGAGRVVQTPVQFLAGDRSVRQGVAGAEDCDGTDVVHGQDAVGESERRRRAKSGGSHSRRASSMPVPCRSPMAADWLSSCRAAKLRRSFSSWAMNCARASGVSMPCTKKTSS